MPKKLLSPSLSILCTYYTIPSLYKWNAVMSPFSAGRKFIFWIFSFNDSRLSSTSCAISVHDYSFDIPHARMKHNRGNGILLYRGKHTQACSVKNQHIGLHPNLHPPNLIRHTNGWGAASTVTQMNQLL